MKLITPEEIKAVLKSKGVTQVALAKKLGVPQSSISKTIHRKYKHLTPHEEKLCQEIAKIIGKTVEEIWE